MEIKLSGLSSLKLLCACDGRACKGVCREKNLYRKRVDKNMPKCPAAYNPPKEKDERR